MASNAAPIWRSNPADVVDVGTSVDVWTLAGTAAAPSVGNLFEGDLSFGSAEALGPGVSTFTTNAPADGTYSLTPTATKSASDASAASSPIPVTSDASAQSSSLNVGPAQSVTVADGVTVEVSGASAQAVTFAGTTGTLKLDNATAFTGNVSGLTGSDTLDLANVSYGPNTTASFSGNATGGTLTVTDGSQSAHIALVGDYLTSGWTLSSDGQGGTAVVDPALSSSGYPNATNTGVQAGVTLTPSGGLTITAPGVYSGLDISNGVTIDASNVTLENCIITMPSSGNWVVGVSGGLTGVTIQNCEIYGTGLSGQVGDYGIYVEGNSQVMINACNIHDVGTGVIVSDGQTTVENCYIHNLNAGPNTHYNGIGFFGGSPADFSLNIQHNTIINQQAQTDAVMIQNYFGNVNNVTVNNNILIGGDYPVYVDASQGTGNITNVSITNNQIGLTQYSFGYMDLNPGTVGIYSVTNTGNAQDGTALLATLQDDLHDAVVSYVVNDVHEAILDNVASYVVDDVRDVIRDNVNNAVVNYDVNRVHEAIVGNVASYVVNEVIRDNVHNAVVNYDVNQVHEAIVDNVQNAVVTRLISHIASSFAEASVGHGVKVASDALQTGNQPLLTNPHHT